MLMSRWDFAKNARSTPKKEKTKQEIIKTAMNTRFMFREGDRANPTSIKAVELIKPRTTPIRALPKIKEYRLIGDIRHSSKDLKNRRSTFSLAPAPLKLTFIEVKAIIPGITKSR